MLLIDGRLLLASLLVGLALDALLGDPRWLWGRVPHPVVAMGRATLWLEQRWLDVRAPAADQARRGRTATLVVIGASALAALAIQSLCLVAPLGWLLLALAVSTLIAARGLYEHVATVEAGLEQGLEQGRRAVGCCSRLAYAP